MRRSNVIVLGLIGVLLLGSTAVLYSKYRRSQADYAQMTAQEQETRTRYGQAIGEIAAIQDSLDAIVVGETPLIPSGGVAEAPGTQRDQMLGRIATLKAGLERTKDRIQDLDARLKKNGIKIAGLERMIHGLKKNVTEKEEMIAQLNTQVDTLQTRVAGLSTEVETKTQELATTNQQLTDQQHELATVFYTIGKKKELMKNGVVVAQGGVLGVGKTLKPSGTFNESVFTTLDTDQEQVIRIPAKKAQVISPQPVSSYTLQPAGENTLELRIVDPKEFRKVKHVVILTT